MYKIFFMLIISYCTFVRPMSDSSINTKSISVKKNLLTKKDEQKLIDILIEIEQINLLSNIKGFRYILPDTISDTLVSLSKKHLADELAMLEKKKEKYPAPAQALLFAWVKKDKKQLM